MLSDWGRDFLQLTLKFKGNVLNDNFQQYTIKNLLKMFAKHNSQHNYRTTYESKHIDSSIEHRTINHRTH